MRTRLLLVAVCLNLAPLPWTAPARAQDITRTIEPDVPEKAGKELKAFHIAGAAPRVDGRLDDEAWGLAARIDDFVQMEPENMQPATERMTAQVAYDARYLYVGVRCFVKDPIDISAGLGRRDNFPRSDRIWVQFDPRHDHQTAYIYMANPSGVQGDQTAYDDTALSSDYDAVWDVETQIDSEGWTAEFRIPFSQMRFEARPGDAVWGFQVGREISRTGEASRWVPTPRGTNGFVSRFGHLTFSDALSPPRRMELLPYALAGIERSSTASTQSSFNGGVDLRIGLGSSTLSATLNPDFGQVEADPAVLNLSVFETFFPEKRPFFLEDSRIFVLPYNQAPDFYSRRIGQTPGRIELKSNEDLVSKPDQTTILGAAKLTGKSSGWTWGGLGALTLREYATVDLTTEVDGETQTIGRAQRLIEPATFYGVGRLQRDIRSSNIGWITTAAVRETVVDAFTGGPDYNLRWGRNAYALNGHWIVTRAEVSDTPRTGFGGVTNFFYSSKYFGVNGHYDHFDKDFRNADVGFLSTRPDKNDASGGFNLGNPNPWKILRTTNLSFYFNRQWTDDGLVFGSQVGNDFNINFRNYWNVNGGAFHNFERLDDLDTRGGPPIVRVAGSNFRFNVNTDSRKTWQINPLGVFGGWDASGARNGFVNFTLRLQPSDRLQASVSTNYTWARDIAQWIENEDLDGDGTDEHVYGRLRRNVVNITGRATYAFSPEMTLEAYMQPFVAVGDYSDIRKLARARSFDFEPVTISDDPDFNRKSLRGTIVMRWEYLPGSTLFLVWNMSNSDTTRPGVFSPLRDLGSGFTADGTNVFVAKLSYWFVP